jgi:hypothetical protein
MTLPKFVVLILSFLLSALASAQAQQAVESAQPPAGTEVAVDIGQSLQRLDEIRRQTLDKQRELQTLRAAPRDETTDDTWADLQRRVEDLPKTIDRLNKSFEQVATGGVDTAVLSDQPPKEFNWKEELLEITRPLIGSLKDLTEKPRKIEELRAQIHTAGDRLAVIHRALESIDRFRQAEPPPPVREKLDALHAEWTQHETDTRSAMEVAQYQLATLRGQDVSYWQVMLEATRDFLSGRGLTLVLAVIAVLFVWLFARFVLSLVLRFVRVASSVKKYRNRERGFLYLYRLFVSIFSVVAVMAIFYVRNDLLLLALTLIALAMVAASLRQTVPKYLKEIRTLLDFGPVREGERIVYGGVPMQVKTIHTFATLVNPELEGAVRLPIDQVVDLVSRPAGDEPWFPCREGEYLLLADGSVAEVLRQTLEMVQLKIMDSLVQMPTSDFIQTGFSNLSRNGFGIRTAFGIDYRHQSICLDPVPRKMHQAVRTAFEASPFGSYLVDLVVEFREAGTSSLDYLIYAKLAGGAAGRYFAVQRLMQQALVDLCNRERWVIPFQQVTLHQGEGFECLSVREADTV